ncbi:Dabb family protein [Cohnella herbarum]|uniref:Dabb family protein n=1 Tax=Cohnella herbarum TaxID=2728023 RepID=A0A7Z2VPL2_9BACL|nr:Dabb family protein [Cohnella herbarum]QJD87146.1 Dabb family protein [Cohnella herbarum]
MIRHLIVFNIRTGATQEECMRVIQRGREQLLTIPGVIHFSFAISVNLDARYRYSLAIDFTDESVIESYKHHPVHVAYADDYFRPLATDRLTIDYRLID